MHIGVVAERLGTTPHTIRFYERRSLIPSPPRGQNGYRDYSETDLSRLRLLVGLRRLDLPLAQASEIASLCSAGRCDEVSDELMEFLAEKRVDLARRLAELRYLDGRLAHLADRIEAGEAPRSLITMEEGGNT